MNLNVSKKVLQQSVTINGVFIKAMQMIYGHFRFMHIAIVKFLIHSPVMFISAMTGAE